MTRMEAGPWLTIALLFAALTLASAPVRAQSCGCELQPITQTTLPDRANGVPIDFAPVIKGFFEDHTVSWQTELGGVVDFELRSSPGTELCHGKFGELLPISLLQPNVGYVIRAQVGDPGTTALVSEIHFRTGGTTVPELPLEPPTFTAAFVEGDAVPTFCGGKRAGCVRIDQGGMFDMTLRDDSGVVLARALVPGQADVELPEVPSKLPECVEIRTRDAAARVSEPTVLCGEQLLRRDARDSDFPGGTLLACKEGAIGDDEPPPRPDAGVPALDAGTPAAGAGGASTGADAGAIPGPNVAPDAGPDAGDAAASGDGGGDGCGCAAHGQAPSGNALAVLCALALLWRRRAAAAQPT